MAKPVARRVKGAVTTRGRRFALKKAARSLRPGVATKITIKLAPKVRAKIRLLLAQRQVATVTVAATATTADGRRVRTTLTFKVKR
jgi:hypothetical protein